MFAEIDATCSSKSKFWSIGIAWLLIKSVTIFIPSSSSFFNLTGLMPFEISISEYSIKAWANTELVVVPSPTSLQVLDATSFINWIPMFVKWSESFNARATVTPSFVTWGEFTPSIITVLPFGPNVDPTALDAIKIPFLKLSLQSLSNLTSLYILF